MAEAAPARTLAYRISMALLRWRRSLFWAGLALSALSCLGLSRIQVDNDYRAFFQADSQRLAASDWLSARQGETAETALLIYEPADGRVFGQRSLMSYVQLAQDAHALPGVANAEGLMDMPKPVFAGTGARARWLSAPMLSGSDLFTDAGRRSIEADALANPLIRGRLLGEGARSAAVILFLDLSGHGSRREQAASLRDAVGKLEASLQAVQPGDKVRLIGTSLFDQAATEVLANDLRIIFPLGIALVFGTLWALYRSVGFVLLASVIIFLPVVATAGVSAAIGLPFSNLIAAGLLLVGTLAVADVVHIANSFYLERASDKPVEAALQTALSKNLWAVTATSSTTAVGETAMLYSASPPVQTMGLVVIIGVFLALALALMMTPWCLTLFGRSQPRALLSLGGLFERVSVASFRNPAPVLGVFVLVMALSLVGISRGRVSDSMNGWFGKSTDFRQALELADRDYLSGRTMTLAVETSQPELRAASHLPELTLDVRRYARLEQQIANPAGAGRWIDAPVAARALRDRLKVPGTTYRVADEIADLPDYSTEDVAKAGLLTRFDPGRADYSLWLFDPDETSSFKVLAAADGIERQAHAAMPGRDVRLAGLGAAFAQLSVDNYNSILIGSVLTFLIVTVSLAVVFRSIPMAMLSIVPNLAPLVVVFGVWGATVGAFNVAAITVFSVALGIVIDDTIHLVLMYQRKRSDGVSAEAAIAEAARSSGTGLLATTVVIAGSFLLLGTSDFLLTAEKARLAGWAIAVAFLFDLTMLPALLAATSRLGKRVRRRPMVQHA